MPLKFLIAPAAYKGSYSPIELCFAIKSGITEVLPEASCLLLPLADGGDGTVESLHHLVGGELVEEEVIHPLFNNETASVRCHWLKLQSTRGDKEEATAIIELASASGIAHLDQEKLSAMTAHTRGTGQVIRKVLDRGLKKMILTVGGSASTDGGTGILYELGARFFDSAGNELLPSGEMLEHIASIDLDGLVTSGEGIDLQIVTDVTNPLCGLNGAARVYGPQKGADEDQVLALDNGLSHYGDVLESKCRRSAARNLPGAGAAGGVPFGLVCALDARIESGFLWYKNITDMETQIKACDIVIGAEGFLDSQSLQGKGTGELARLCAEYQKPLWLVPARADHEIDWLDYHVERVKETCREGKVATLADVQRTVAGLVELIVARN